MNIGYSAYNNTLGVDSDNLINLIKILKWNVSNNIKLFRISNNLLNVTISPTNKLLLLGIGRYIKKNDIRISFHASPTCVLSSDKEMIVKKSLKHLEDIRTIYDYMELDHYPYYKINLHVGSFKDSKDESAKRFVKNFMRLSKETQQHITIENDDKSKGFTVNNLYELIFPYTSTPIVMDFFHYRLNPGSLSEEESLNLALSTWGDIIPSTHFCSSKMINEQCESNHQKNSHANYIYEKIPTYGRDFDVMLESHATDLSYLKYLKDFL